MSEKNEFDFEKDQNTNIDVTGGTDMDTNENENSVQETVQQTGENGFFMSDITMQIILQINSNNQHLHRRKRKNINY